MLTLLARAGVTAAAILLVLTTLAPAETLATPASTIVAQQSAPADFGSPPSGSIPILFNDHHVYTKPDVLKQGRVLSALVRGGTILIPLRSMFEQMGATVSYDPSTKTADVSKDGADVKVTVGKPEVVINGESRPLDVAPIYYHGDVLVPIRVISEGMGAYVQWIPDKQLVVVRYLPPTPPPAPATEAPAPTMAPTMEPTATPAPVMKRANPLTIDGYARAYDFYRDNAYSGHAAANAQTENNAISLGGQYRFEGTGLSVGANYVYANPLDGCGQASSALYPANPTNTCYYARSVSNGGKAYMVPDNTMPPFDLSTLYQAYLQYNDSGVYIKAGDQVINTPWANASDSRLKPNAFQGADASLKLSSNWTIEGAYFDRWECRTCSNFDQGTLLTALSIVPKYTTNPALPYGTGGTAIGYSGANAYPGNYYDPYLTQYNTGGFGYGRLGYAGDKTFPFTANLYYYGFDNISNVLWADAKLGIAASGRYKAFIAFQGGDEQNAGTALLGKIASTVYGIQAGFNPLPNVTLTGGYDNIPIKTDTVTLPNGFKCSAAHTISSPTSTVNPGVSGYGGNLPYFLPSGGTGNCYPGANGTTNIVYGGWASPYTDSYATDPLFTTGGTQGMIDRRSPGQSAKIAATFLSDNRQFTATVAQEWYDYNNLAYAQGTNSTDFDTQYFFSHIPKSGPYHGFSLRVRLFSRSESYFPGSSAGSLFKYNRFQAEYDF